MFTGLVSAVSPVVSLRKGTGGALLAIGKPPEYEPVSVGESVAVSGVCLTAVPGDTSDHLFFDVSPETLARSTLGALEVGMSVNLERSLLATDRLGGHIVAGHVDGTARVLAVEPSGDSWTFRFELPAALARFLVEKGSIAVDGVSLTVAALGDGSFDVAVIPHTFHATTLGGRKASDSVNLEVDVLAKYVERLVAARVGA